MLPQTFYPHSDGGKIFKNNKKDKKVINLPESFLIVLSAKLKHVGSKR